MATEVAKAIFDLDIEFDRVLTGLNQVKGKYTEVTDNSRKQVEILNSLKKQEADLLAGRAKANSPTAVVQYNKALQETQTKIIAVNAEVKKLAIEEKALGAQTALLGKQLGVAFETTKINGSKAAMKGNAEEAKGLTKIMGTLGPVVLAAFGVGKIVEFGSKVLETRAEFQKYQAVLTNLFGSKSIADDTFARLQHFAAVTPFSVKELTASFVKLANQGFQPTNKELTKLGDLAASQGKSFDQLAEAVLDAQTGEFERLKEFGIKASQSGDKVSLSFKGQTTIVNKNNEAIRNAIVAMGGLKGIAGGMAAVSETLGGKLSNLGDNFDALLNNLGEQAEGTFGFVLDEMNDFLTKVNLIEAATNKARKGLKGSGLEFSFLENLSGSSKAFATIQLQIDALRSSALEAQSALDFKKSNDSLLELSSKLKGGFDTGKIGLQEYQRALLLVEKGIAANGDGLKKFLKDQDAVNGNANQSAASFKKAQEQLKKELDTLEKLREQLQKVKDEGATFEIKTKLSGADQVNAEFDLKKQQINRELQLQKDGLSEQFKNRKRYLEAEQLLNQIIINSNKNLEAERTLALKKEYETRTSNAIEAAKKLSETQADIDQANTGDELTNLDEKLSATSIYYEARIRLAREAGKTEQEILELSKEGELAIANLKKNRLTALLNQNKSEIDEQERHILALMGIEGRKNTDILQTEIDFEKQKLELLKQSGLNEEEEILKQQNKIDELQKQKDKEDKQNQKQKLINILDGIQTITNAFFKAIDDAYNRKIQRIDQALSIQQNQVERAKAIADKGNAEMLNQEQKRLDSLNKKKAQYIREQQALATAELVANTIITISKAAAEGGAAAPFTIAAALIALGAGLANARALASQAAFFDGGEYNGKEGYTGDGNIHDSSRALGDKPYTYHKKEYIFNNEKTNKFRKIFKGVHEGSIDLNEWESKLRLYEQFNMNRMNINQRVQLDRSPTIAIDLASLNDRIDNLTRVVENAPGAHLNFDANGIDVVTRTIQRRNDRINNLAKS